MKRIFGAILSSKLVDFEDEVRLLGDSLMLVCVGVYQEIVKGLLPTPSKSHYVFNMRDLAKVKYKSKTQLNFINFKILRILLLKILCSFIYESLRISKISLNISN